jgi:two-component system sensor histidine kinase UhpB
VVYRVAQEGLTNAIRHSEASRVTMELTADDGRVALIVADDGRGMSGGSEGAGIKGMRERAVLIGAHLAIGDRDGGGAEVRLEVPI